MSTWKTTEQAALARRLLRRTDSGILSTMSTELPDYPFGSVTPYVTTHEGRVVVYVSEIAQHTANMRASSKVCLTAVEERGEENQQAVGRVTVVGDARPVPEDARADVLERYFGYFPEAREYGGVHGFLPFWIEPLRVRYIGGFGRIFWVEREDWIVPSPEWAPDEGGIVEHMNADHAGAVSSLADRHGAREPAGAKLLALDAEGFHLRAGTELVYVPFHEPCLSSEQVRAGMIRLVREP